MLFGCIQSQCYSISDGLLLDKTGTITIGNRKATAFYPIVGVERQQFIQYCLLSSVSDDTPEGKSIVELAHKDGLSVRGLNTQGARMIKFTAETKSSGIILKDGTEIRKGAYDAIRRITESAGESLPERVMQQVKDITSNGGTPLVVAVNKKVVGVIELQDIIKPGIHDRFERLRKMGVKTVMVTGDNQLTAKYIAEKAGVDDFIAEAKPEDKMNYIKVIPLLIPLALRGVKYKPIGASALLRRNLLIFGVGGVIAPFVGIKLIDLLIGLFF